VIKINVNAWKSQSAEAKARLKVKAGEYVRRTAMKVFNEAVRVSPQWSGEFVSQWALVIGAPNAHGLRPVRGYGRLKVTPWYTLENPRSVGDKSSYADNTRLAKLDVKEAKWNSIIMLVNTSPTADIVESYDFRPRKANYAAATPVLVYLKMKFDYLNQGARR
jgi:hypothetical protein